MKKLIFALLAFALLVIGCNTSSHDRPIVVVSIEPQKDILQHIVGEKYDVRCLLAAGGNPENYEPSFSNLLNVEHSLAYLAMGNLPFEQAVTGKITHSNPALLIFNTSEGILPIFDSAHQEADPHTWMSVKNMKVIVANMLDAMCRVAPQDSDLFRRNAEAFTLRLDSLDNAISARLADESNKRFIVWHPSLGYFARDYGLEQIAIGGAENKEPSLIILKQRLDSARDSGAKVFFLQTGIDGRFAQTSLQHLPDGIRSVEINVLDPDWQSAIESVANALAQ